MKLLSSGGMASVMLNWMTNGLLQDGMGDPELQITVGMRPTPRKERGDDAL